MDRRLAEVLGEDLSPKSIAIPKADELVRFLASGAYPFGTLRSACRRLDGTEGVLLDLSIEVGQEPLHDIRSVEPVAILFSPLNERCPEVLSLRSDFPQVPHQQLRDEEFPKGLCLYEEPYTTIRLSWTAARFLERIRNWFRDTARGILHQEDQPLEPILLTGRRYLIIPPDLFARGTDETPDKLWVIPRASSHEGEFFIARRVDQVTVQEQQNALAYLATTFECQPQTHGVIHKTPKNLLDLHNLTLPAGLDLLARLRDRMLTWNRGDAPLNAHLIVIVFFPKSRTVGHAPEVPDIWAFMTGKTILQIGAKLGYWQPLPNGHVAGLIGHDLDSAKAASIDVFVLDPVFALNRYRAALMNGYSPSAISITAVGVGALGSQIVTNLIRSGFGSWVLIDNDYLLPHNVARHELTQTAVGFSKAEMLQMLGNSITEDRPVTTAIVADVLAPNDRKEQVDVALRAADLILDFSASIPVARHLANIPLSPRRISAFLNPNATDLVILAEDSARRIPLDCLEMQFYRELCHRSEFSSHLIDRSTGRIRYAQTCRDLTSDIPEDLVGLHSAIAAKALRELVNSPDAVILIWRAADDRSVTSFRSSPAELYETTQKGWRLRSDGNLIMRLAALRAEGLQNETGGVLVGAFDLERRIVYVADVILSPPDSREQPALYIRGCEGLAAQLEEIGHKTGGMLEYVGEWHSHPDGFSTNPSEDDRRVLDRLAEHMQKEGLPPVMAIVGEGANIRWFVDAIE